MEGYCANMMQGHNQSPCGIATSANNKLLGSPCELHNNYGPASAQQRADTLHVQQAQVAAFHAAVADAESKRRLQLAAANLEVAHQRLRAGTIGGAPYPPAPQSVLSQQQQQQLMSGGGMDAALSRQSALLGRLNVAANLQVNPLAHQHAGVSCQADPIDIKNKLILGQMTGAVHQAAPPASIMLPLEDRSAAGQLNGVTGAFSGLPADLHRRQAALALGLIGGCESSAGVPLDPMNGHLAHDKKHQRQHPQKERKPKRKKAKGKPKRPLSAYNLFFKDERARILESIPNPQGYRKSKKKNKKLEQQQQMEGMGTTKRSPPHGKIGFENLAKIIGRRWKELPPEEAEHYKKLAEVEMRQYKLKMKSFLAKLQEENDSSHQGKAVSFDGNTHTDDDSPEDHEEDGEQRTRKRSMNELNDSASSLDRDQKKNKRASAGDVHDTGGAGLNQFGSNISAY